MSEDEEIHIIDYILRNTEKKKVNSSQERRKKSCAYENRKIRMDDMIYYCEFCKQTWSYVPKFINHSGWRSYSPGNIPTIGKKRKECKKCRERNEDNKK